MRIHRDQLIWLAGFLDGEGSFFASRVTLKRSSGEYLSYRPRVFGCNTHAPTVDLVYELFSAYGKTSRTIKKTGPRNKAVHHVNIPSWEGCKVICEEIEPFLVTKKEQAGLLKDWATDRLYRQEQFGKYGTKWNDEDHNWYERLRVLNARGGSEYYER